METRQQEMIDFRTKVTERTAQVLEAVKRATGKDQAEIAREVLDNWAAERIHESNLIIRLTKREGGDPA